MFPLMFTIITTSRSSSIQMTSGSVSEPELWSAGLRRGGLQVIWLSRQFNPVWSDVEFHRRRSTVSSLPLLLPICSSPLPHALFRKRSVLGRLGDLISQVLAQDIF